MHRRKDGWRVQWVAKGKRYSKTFSDIKAARRFEMEIELGVADMTPMNRRTMTFGELAEKWLKDHCEVRKSETQWVHDRRTYELHLKPTLAKVPLESLSQNHLLEIRATLRVSCAGRLKRPLSPRSVNNAIGLAKAIAGFGVSLDVLGLNPFRSVAPLKLGDQVYSYWTAAQRDQFLAVAQERDPDFATLVLVAAHTGLRLGELAGLKRQHLHFERRKIAVNESYNLKLGKRLPTKNRTCAEVPMNEAVHGALAPRRFLQADRAVFELALFHNARRRLGHLAKAADVPVIRFHDLRHTFASTLAMAGVDLMTIQKLCRHKSYQMTLRYAHIAPEHLVGVTEVLCTKPAPEPERESKSGAVGRI